MKVKLTEVTTKHELYTSSINTRASYKNNSFPQSSSLKRMHVNELCFSGLNFLFLQLQTLPTARLLLEYSKPGYCICIVLEGESYFGAGIEKGSIQVAQYSFQHLRDASWISNSSKNQVLFIGVDPDRIQGVRLVDQAARPLPHHMHRVLSEIMQCTADCPIRCIFIESKILSLLHLVCEDIQRESPAFEKKNSTGLNEKDIEKLKDAERYIVQHLAKTYTVIELAHHVGLNDFKLKKGFKALFGSTIFNYRHSIRMIKAKEMLQSGFLVNEVSEEIGYKHAHHFSVAFKAYFDVSPSKIKD